MFSCEPLVAPGSRYYNYAAGALARSSLLCLQCIGLFTYLPGYQLTRRSYDSFLLEVILDGELEGESDGRPFRAVRGNAVLLDCYHPHHYASATGWQALWLHFDGPGARGYYDWITRSGGPVLAPENFEELHRSLAGLFQQFDNGSIPGEGQMAREIAGALGLLLDPPETPPGSGGLDRVLRTINENLHRELSVQQLAEQAHFSEYHFIRLFRSQVGTTPRQYIITARMERARHLLKTTDLPLETISEQVGYTSDSVFCTQFKRSYRVTPTAYRRT